MDSKCLVVTQSWKTRVGQKTGKNRDGVLQPCGMGLEKRERELTSHRSIHTNDSRSVKDSAAKGARCRAEEYSHIEMREKTEGRGRNNNDKR